MIILKNGGIKIIIMNTKLKAILGLTSISLLIYTTYEQNKTINSQKFEINALKKSIEHIDSAASKQYDELFETQALLGRYQMTLEILKDGEDKKAAQTFEYVLTTQTE
jgi:hypothetical protein